MSDQLPIYLVYVRGLKSPSPQLWYTDQTKGNDRYKYKAVGEEGSDLLYFRALSPDDQRLSLDQLVAKYPYRPNVVVTKVRADAG